jgi:undecaprenyl-diphosphatase
LVVAVLGWLAMVALGLRFAGEEQAGSVDRTLIDAVHGFVGDQGPLASFLVSPTDGIVIYGVIATLIVVAIVTRRWEFAVLAVSSPLLCVLLTEVVFKPLFDRRFQGGLSYPSGHTVSFVSALSAALLIVLALMAGRPWLLRALFMVAWFVLSVAAMVGLVAMNYHYPTDAVGGFCIAIGVVLPCALMSDALAAVTRRRRFRTVSLPEPRIAVTQPDPEVQRAHD